MKIIGIDAGGTWVKAGLFTSDLTLQDSVQMASGASRGVEAYFDMIGQATAQLGGAEAVGLALPGTLSRDKTVIEYAANITGLMVHDRSPVRLQDALASKLGTTQIVADNDAGCAALAEWKLGLGQGDRAKTLLHITWGTGIGTGFICDGVSEYGWEGGHLPLAWDVESDVPCNCGSSRDLEAFVAVPHLVKRTGLSPESLLAQAEAGGSPSAEVVQEALRWLARGVHMMSVLVYPEIVSVGGGFMASDWLLQQLREHMQKEAHGYLGTSLQPDMVQRAQLQNDAGMIGAAIMAQHSLL